MCIRSHLVNGLITAFVGCLTIIFTASFGWVALPKIVQNLIDENTILKDSAFVWDLWTKPPFPIHMQFYLFNCTNPEEVLLGTKPNVTQVGPYTFRELRVKDIVNPQEDVVYYLENRRYYFVADRSLGNLTDVITTVNPIYMTLAKFADFGAIFNPIVLPKLNNLLKQNNEDVFMTYTVGELLFEGWPITQYFDIYQNITDSLPMLPLPDLPPGLLNMTRFGLFSWKNDTDDGFFKVKTGANDRETFAEIDEWNNSTHLNFWAGGANSFCNAIHGTDGTVFPMGLNISKRLYIFQSDLCRTIYAEYVNDTVIDGIQGWKFVVPGSVLASYEEQPENICFCKEVNVNATCYKSGILNLGKCYSGAPLLGSYPHFLHGDEEYIRGVIGMQPEQALHETVVVIEPRTSVLLYASKKVQLSIHLDRYKLDSTKKLNSTILPVLWFDEEAVIDEDTKSILGLFALLDVAYIILWVIIAIGILLIVVGMSLVILHRIRPQEKRQKPKKGKKYSVEYGSRSRLQRQ